MLQGQLFSYCTFMIISDLKYVFSFFFIALPFFYRFDPVIRKKNVKS